MDFLFPYNENKMKPYLKMAVQRIQIHNNKKTTAVKIQKKEVAQLLAEHKDEKAKIRAEHIIRDDFTIEGLELLELNLELIHERIKQITTSKECPADMKEAVCSVIWAVNNIDIAELKEVANQLTKKFGSKFAEAAQKNENNEVNVRLFNKLTYRPPSKMLVRKYLEEIAKAYDVEWQPDEKDFEEEHAPFSSPSGTSIPMAPGSGLTAAYSNQNTVAPHLRLNDAELEEYSQFLRNQSQGRPSFNPGEPPAPTPPPAQTPPNNNNSSNNNNNNNNGGGGIPAPFVPYYPGVSSSSSSSTAPPPNPAPVAKKPPSPVEEQLEIPIVEAEIYHDDGKEDGDFTPATASFKPVPPTNITVIPPAHVTPPPSAPAPTSASSSAPPPPPPPPAPPAPPASNPTSPPVDPLQDLQARLAALNKRHG